MSRWSFKTTLVRPEGVGTWTFAPIPVDLVKQTGIKARLRVKGTIDAVPFKGTLLPFGSGKHFVVVKKELTDKIGKNAGDVVKVEFDLDTSPSKYQSRRTLQLPCRRRLVLRPSSGIWIPRTRKPM